MRLEARIPPVLVFLAALAIMRVGVALFPEWTGEATSGTQTLIVVLLVCGGILGAAGVASFMARRTTLHPNHPERASTLVTTGIYRVTRNPMYLGLACLLGAYGAHVRHPAVAVALLFFIGFITRFQIVPEERALKARFGAAYDAYAAHVRRWL